MSDSSAVLLDTGVFTAALKRGSPIAALYTSDIVGRKTVISFQTEAEARFGALVGGWGDRRMRDLEDRLDRSVVVPPHADLSKECAQLRFECQLHGHAFHHKIHAGDLWIASTARWLGLPVITHDTGFRGLPGVNVICHA